MGNDIAAIFAGIAGAFVVVVWAMQTSIGDRSRRRKDAPLCQPEGWESEQHSKGGR